MAYGRYIYITIVFMGFINELITGGHHPVPTLLHWVVQPRHPLFVLVHQSQKGLSINGLLHRASKAFANEPVLLDWQR